MPERFLESKTFGRASAGAPDVPQQYVDSGPRGARARLLIALDIEPERNGVATYWGDLAQWLGQEGIDVAVLCAAAGAAPPRYVPLAPLVRLPLLGDATQIVSFPRMRAVEAAFRAFRPSLVAIPVPGPVALGALRAARREGIPVVATVHTDLTAVVRGLFPEPVQWMILASLRAIERFIINRATVVTAPGAGHARSVATRFDVAVREMATPLSPALCEPVTERPARPIERVLYVGRLSPEKNLDALLHAARVHADLAFCVVGSGPEQQRLQHIATANVEFQPWQERSAVRQILDDSDLVVLPSTIDTFGTAALEAMARAKPIIVSPACGIATLIRDGVDGLVLRSGETLGSRIAAARALSPTCLEAIGTRARLRALTYSRRCVQEWLTLVTELTAGPCARRS